MASDDTDIIPFRWDLGRREQLGQLLQGEAERFPAAYLDELRETAAKIVARGGDADLVFLGRSPENIFDYLSGAFASLAPPRSLTLLQGSFSGLFEEPSQAELEPLLGYFRSERLDPQSLAAHGKAVRFVDVVYTGRTFRFLVRMLADWSARDGADWNVVKRRIGFIGLTRRGKNSPNTYRWQQDEDWLASAPGIFVKNVSMDRQLWRYIADDAPKVTPSHRRERWASADARKPPREDARLKALRGAVRLYDLGSSADERSGLARLLARQPEMAEPWLRGLVLNLKTRKGQAPG